MDSPSNHEDNTAKDAPSQLAPEPYPAINDGSNSDSQSLPIRETVGNSMDRFTEIVNNNLIAARFGAFATITLLTVYGISQTPLFFRYRTVSEVPGKRYLEAGDNAVSTFCCFSIPTLFSICIFCLF